MPDKREHRGPHPADATLFARDRLPSLSEALADFSLLLTKGYADKSALKLVGDRFGLMQRQRLAVMRSACSDQQRQSRLSRQVDLADLPDRILAIDGYNLLITIEAAMSGGLIFRGRDGCCRDLASIHGTYRKVEETIPALELIGAFLAEIGVGAALWLLDSPVSNSGRLKTLITNLAVEHRWPWTVRLSINPDAELRSEMTMPVGWGSPHRFSDELRWGKPHPTATASNRQPPAVVVTTDSVILDTCPHWTNLASDIISRQLSEASVIDLG